MCVVKFQKSLTFKGLTMSQLEMTKASLQSLLNEIEANDTNYSLRYSLVLKALCVANALEIKTGFRWDPNENGWTVITIELPTGEVSWHMPNQSKEFEGYDNKVKYERCHAYCAL